MTRKVLLALLLFIALIVAPLYAQTPVALAPVGRQQFLYSTGDPLAGGCVSTFAAGTSTPLATYTDVTGAIQNANPITLDAGGFATIYLSNAEYKIQVNAAPSSGSCSPSNLGPQQWVQDNVSAYQIINGISNLFFSGVTSDPSGSAGEVVYRSDLPCFRGFTTIWDCFVQTQLSQTLTNKTMDPDFNTFTGGTPGEFLRSNGVKGVWSAITPPDVTAYSNTSLTNSASGTTQFGLVKLVTVGAASEAQGTATTDTNGVIGICLSGCGVSGTPSIVQAGSNISCQFDGPTTAGDYIQNSTTIATDCHDTGASVPSTGQVVGRVISTQGGTPLAAIILFPPQSSSSGGFKFEGANLTPVTVGNTVTPSNLITFSMPANEMGAGQTFYIDAQGIIGDTAAPSISITLKLDSTTVCTLTPTLTAGNSQPWSLRAYFTGLSTGSAGSITGCHISWSSSPSGGGNIGNETGIGSPAQSVTIDTTVSHTLTFQVTWGTANTLNTITENTLIIQRIG